MKLIKTIFIVLSLIVLTPLIIAIFIDKGYTVERSVAINQPKQVVFDYIKYLENQANYSKWDSMDPAMKKTYSGQDAQPGFVYRWESEKDEVGWGEQEILKISEAERIDFELRFLKPFKSVSSAYLSTTYIEESQTEVTWGFHGEMAYPSNLMLLFFDMEEMIGNDLEVGLANLKSILENQ